MHMNIYYLLYRTSFYQTKSLPALNNYYLISVSYYLNK